MGTVSVGPVAGATGDPGPYVITFAAAFEKMPLAVPFLHQLDHFSAFRSHTIERGRSVFRLHVGYFESQDAARAALKIVRRHYTDAHIATAPRRDLGSLDDTGITEFRVARSAAGHDAAPAEEDRPRRDPEVVPDAARCDNALQRYAIQLDALARAGGSASAPDLVVFRAHTLYRIYVLLDEGLHQALRLGFFASVEAAHKVLVHVRDRFPRANLVPVSAREYGRVRDLGPSRAPDATQAPPAERQVLVVAGRDAASDDVSCEFGAHELPSADRDLRMQPRR